MSKQHLLEKEDNNKLQIVGMEKRLHYWEIYQYASKFAMFSENEKRFV